MKAYLYFITYQYGLRDSIGTANVFSQYQYSGSVRLAIIGTTLPNVDLNPDTLSTSLLNFMDMKLVKILIREYYVGNYKTLFGTKTIWSIMTFCTKDEKTVWVVHLTDNIFGCVEVTASGTL